MLDVTNREFRQLMRILSKRVTLWTEMVVDGTILHSDDLENHLGYEEHNSHPIVCQLGGNNPDTISKAVATVLEYGFDEININMGCPSSLVAHKNKFGAVLMKEIDMAKQAVQAMEEATKGQHDNIRISVKCRIGVDELDSIDHLTEFVQALEPHVQIFYLHARKAVLGGKFTTKQNRAIPPLNYPRVYELCRRFPDCEFYINGGIPDLKAAKELCFGTAKEYDDDAHHQVPCDICQFPNGSCIAPLSIPPSNLKGCLMGRTPRDNPCLMWDIDRYFYGEATNPCQNRWQVLTQYLDYIETVIPRRCCDTDPRDTRRLPTPFAVKSDYTCCPYCMGFGSSSMRHDQDEVIEPDCIAPLDYGGTKPKITSHIYSRVLRPLIGILNGIPRAKTFRREFDRILQQEARFRNCGPSAVIRRSIRVIDREHLLKDFEKTEDILTDYSRSIDCCRGSRNW